MMRSVAAGAKLSTSEFGGTLIGVGSKQNPFKISRFIDSNHYINKRDSKSEGIFFFRLLRSVDVSGWEDFRGEAELLHRARGRDSAELSRHGKEDRDSEREYGDGDAGFFGEDGRGGERVEQIRSTGSGRAFHRGGEAEPADARDAPALNGFDRGPGRVWPRGGRSGRGWTGGRRTSGASWTGFPTRC